MTRSRSRSSRRRATIHAPPSSRARPTLPAWSIEPFIPDYYLGVIAAVRAATRRRGRCSKAPSATDWSRRASGRNSPWQPPASIALARADPPRQQHPAAASRRAEPAAAAEHHHAAADDHDGDAAQPGHGDAVEQHGYRRDAAAGAAAAARNTEPAWLPGFRKSMDAARSVTAPEPLRRSAQQPGIGGERRRRRRPAPGGRPAPPRHRRGADHRGTAGRGSRARRHPAEEHRRGADAGRDARGPRTGAPVAARAAHGIDRCAVAMQGMANLARRRAHSA